MRDFEKRLRALEERLLGTARQRFRQRAAAEKCTLRWFVTDGIIGGIDGEEAHRVPADAEAAWLDFLRWREEAPPDEPKPDLDRDRFFELFEAMKADDHIHQWELFPA